MIIRNASKASLLTGQNAAGQRLAIAHDHPGPTPGRSWPPRRVIAAGWVRAQVFIHSVPPQQPWPSACPALRTSADHLPPRQGMAATIALPQWSKPHWTRAGVAEAATVSATVPLRWTVHDPLVLAAYLLTGLAGTALAYIDSR
jgi:hypothetical protein